MHAPILPSSNGRPKPSLADVLSDPTAEWSDIREAIKTQGRGSFLGGGKRGGPLAVLAATTNAGVLEALRESRASNFTKDEHPRQDEDDHGEGNDDALTKGELCVLGEDGDGRGVTFTDSVERRKVTGIGGAAQKYSGKESKRNNDSDTPRVEDGSFGERRRRPARRLIKTNSVKGRSFRASLKNVTEDVVAEMGDLDDSSADTSFSLPKRYVPRGNSANKGGSFRGLKDVTEGAEADGAAGLAGDHGRRRRTPAARRMPGKKSSIRRKSLDSVDLYNSNASISVASLDPLSSSFNKSISAQFNESVNIMDFGVDHNPRQSLVSIGAFSKTSTGTSMSDLVDSDGFLDWGNDSNSTAASLPSGKNDNRSALQKGPPKRSESSDTNSDMNSSSRSDLAESMNSSACSNLVDSMGFLDWDDQPSQTNDDKDVGASKTIWTKIKASIEDEKVLSDAEEDNEDEEAPQKLMESWRIEDYEDPEGDTFDLSRQSAPNIPYFGANGSGNILTRLMNKAPRRNSHAGSVDSRQEGIKTDDIKRCLLTGHAGADEPSSESAAKKKAREGSDGSDGTLRRSSFGSFLSSANRRFSDRSSSEDVEDERYSRPAIRISREDNIDIGELRKELCEAGCMKQRRKMSFF